MFIPACHPLKNDRGLSYDTGVYQTTFETLWRRLKRPNRLEYWHWNKTDQRRYGR